MLQAHPAAGAGVSSLLLPIRTLSAPHPDFAIPLAKIFHAIGTFFRPQMKPRRSNQFLMAVRRPENRLCRLSRLTPFVLPIYGDRITGAASLTVFFVLSWTHAVTDAAWMDIRGRSSPPNRGSNHDSVSLPRLPDVARDSGRPGWKRSGMLFVRRQDPDAAAGPSGVQPAGARRVPFVRRPPKEAASRRALARGLRVDSVDSGTRNDRVARFWYKGIGSSGLLRHNPE